MSDVSFEGRATENSARVYHADNSVQDRMLREDMLNNFPLVLNPYEDAHFLIGLDDFQIDEKEDFKRITHALLLSDGSKSLVGGWEIPILKTAVKELFGYEDVKEVDLFVKQHFDFRSFEHFIKAAKDIAEVKDGLVLPFIDDSTREIYQDAIASIKNKDEKTRRQDERVAKRIENVENIEGFYRGVNRVQEAVDIACERYKNHPKGIADVDKNDGTRDTVVGVNYNHACTEYEKLFGTKLSTEECKLICGRSSLHKALAGGHPSFTHNFYMQQLNTNDAAGMYIAKRPGFHGFTEQEIQLAIVECKRNNAEKQQITKKWENKGRRDAPPPSQSQAQAQAHLAEMQRKLREEQSVPPSMAVPPSSIPNEILMNPPQNTIENRGGGGGGPSTSEQPQGYGQAKPMPSPPVEKPKRTAEQVEEEHIDDEEEEDEGGAKYSDEDGYDSDDSEKPVGKKKKAPRTVSAPTPSVPAPIPTPDEDGWTESEESPVQHPVVPPPVSSLSHYDEVPYGQLPSPSHVLTLKKGLKSTKDELFKMKLQLLTGEGAQPVQLMQSERGGKPAMGNDALKLRNKWEEDKEDESPAVRQMQPQPQQQPPQPVAAPAPTRMAGAGIFDPQPIPPEAYDMPTTVQHMQQQQMQPQQSTAVDYPPAPSPATQQYSSDEMRQMQQPQQKPFVQLPHPQFLPPLGQQPQQMQQQPYAQPPQQQPYSQQPQQMQHDGAAAAPSQSSYYSQSQQQQQSYGAVPPMSPIEGQQGPIPSPHFGQPSQPVYPPNQQYYPGQQVPPPPQSVPQYGPPPTQPQGYQQGPTSPTGYGPSGQPYPQQGPLPSHGNHHINVQVNVPPYQGTPPPQGYPTQTPPPGGYPAAPPSHPQYQPAPPQSAYPPSQQYPPNPQYQQPHPSGYGAPPPQHYQSVPPSDPGYPQQSTAVPPQYPQHQKARDQYYPLPSKQHKYAKPSQYRDTAPTNHRDEGYGREEEEEEEARRWRIDEERKKRFDELSEMKRREEIEKEEARHKAKMMMLKGIMPDRREMEKKEERPFGISSRGVERRNEGGRGGGGGGGRDQYHEDRSDYSGSRNGGGGGNDGLASWRDRHTTPAQDKADRAMIERLAALKRERDERKKQEEELDRLEEERRRQKPFGRSVVEGMTRGGRRDYTQPIGTSTPNNNTRHDACNASFHVARPWESHMEIDNATKRIKNQIIEIINWRRMLNHKMKPEYFELLTTEELFALIPIGCGNDLDTLTATTAQDGTYKNYYWLLREMERENLLIRYQGKERTHDHREITVMYVSDLDTPLPAFLRVRRVSD